MVLPCRYSPTTGRALAAVVCALAVAAAGPQPARATAPGDLDQFFGGTGWTHVPAGTGANAVAIQPDGLIVVAGTVPGIPTQLAVWRFFPDGSPDFSFNDTGQSGLMPGTPGNPGFTNSSGHAVAVGFDGRIYVGGDSALSVVIPSVRPIVAAFLPDGHPDLSFGSLSTIASGFVRMNATGTTRALLPLADGRICAVASGARSTIARWLPNGLPDNTLNGTGFTFLPGAPTPVLANLSGSLGFVQQPDGKMLVARDQPTFAISRLVPEGFADLSFASGGTVSLNAGDNIQAACRHLVALPEGKFLAAGHYTDASTATPGFLLARFLPDGTPDQSFGDGIVPGRILRPAGTAVCTSAGLAVQSDGRILLAGSAGAAADYSDILLMRFTPDGRPDPAFGNGGMVRTDLGNSHDHPRAATLQFDQGLVVAGSYLPSNGGPEEILLARFAVPPTGTLSIEHPPGAEAHFLNFGPVTAGIAIKTLTLRNDSNVPLTNLQAVIAGESIPGNYHLSPSTLPTLAPHAETTLDVSLIPTAAPGLRTAGLAISTGSEGPAPRTILLQGSKATPQEIWRTTWFGSPDNSGPGADLNDFDGDGLPNFMEFATRTNPHTYSAFPCQPAGTGKFAYTRPSATLTDFSYTPESAPSPAGPWSSSGLTSIVLTDDGTVQTVQVTRTATPSAARLFLRLRVTQLPPE